MQSTQEMQEKPMHAVKFKPKQKSISNNTVAHTQLESKWKN